MCIGLVIVYHFLRVGMVTLASKLESHHVPYVPAAMLALWPRIGWDCRQCSARDGHGSARHETQCSAGCVAQPLYPWRKAELKRFESLDRVDRQMDKLPAFSYNDIRTGALLRFQDAKPPDSEVSRPPVSPPLPRQRHHRRHSKIEALASKPTNWGCSGYCRR